MNSEELLKLAIPMMIHEDTRKFISRKERNWRQDFIDLGIPDVDKAWKFMMTLTTDDEEKPPELDRDGSGQMIYTFEKEMPNGVWAYIKIKIKDFSNTKKCVSISFHPCEYGPKAKINKKILGN